MIAAIYARKIAIAPLLALALAGCATYGRIGPLPVIPDGSPTAEIIVAREYRFTGSAGPIAVAIDGIVRYQIGTNEYVRIPVPPGRHIVGVRVPIGEEPSLALDAEAGRRYGYLTWIGSIFHPGPFIRAVEDIEVLTAERTHVR
jgi:hypothetical protein